MSKILFSSLVVCLSMSLGCGGCRDGASPSVSPECGDGMCNGDETVECCPEDCPWFSCGNGVCEAGEVSDCPQDCTAGGCGNGVCEANEDPASCAEDCPGSHKVDVLFVIDNSLGAEWNLGAVLHNLYGPFLEGSDGRLPDLHIGFVSTDLGAGSYDTIRGCEEVGGDRGVLGRMRSEDLGELCSGTSDRYVVDLEPQGCFIERDGDGGCLSHGCTQQECTALEDGPVSLTLYENENGCPRCRNSGSATDVYLTCIAESTVGRECGFEQPFEAMKKALDVSEAPENEGFLRADAVLAVMFLTDEDDCSALQPDVIFDPDPAQDRVGSELGCLTSFRCFEFGVSCDVDGREVGPRRDCRPMTEKQGALLFPLDRYSQFLGNLKDPGRVVVGAMAGPVSDEIVVQLGLEPEGCPELAVACERTLGAYPAVRIQALLSLFQSERDLEEWTTGMCSANPEIRALEVFGRQIVDRLGWK